MNDIETLEYIADECERLERRCAKISPPLGLALLEIAHMAFREFLERVNAPLPPAPIPPPTPAHPPPAPSRTS